MTLAQLPIIIVVACMALYSLWPSIKGLFSGVLSRVPSVATGGGPISRDAAVAGLLTARDYSHQEGKHQVCKDLGSCFAAMIDDAETKPA